MSLGQKEIAKNDADKKKGGTDEVWQEVRKGGEKARRREDGRHGGGRMGEGTTNCGPNDCPNGPNEGHDGICLCCKMC